MSDQKPIEYWSVWYPKAAATGVLILRSMIDPQQTVLVHAAPDTVTVEVTDRAGNRIAFSQDLQKTADSPMCRLRRAGNRLVREDIWPTDDDLGTIVLLPGGEAGVLKRWWHAEDRKEWRWQVEFYNSTR